MLTDVSERRAHRRGRHAKHFLDSFACIAELSNYLLVCQGRKRLIENCHQQGAARA